MIHRKNGARYYLFYLISLHITTSCLTKKIMGRFAFRPPTYRNGVAGHTNTQTQSPSHPPAFAVRSVGRCRAGPLIVDGTRDASVPLRHVVLSSSTCHRTQTFTYTLRAESGCCCRCLPSASALCCRQAATKRTSTVPSARAASVWAHQR